MIGNGKSSPRPTPISPGDLLRGVVPTPAPVMGGKKPFSGGCAACGKKMG